MSITSQGTPAQLALAAEPATHSPTSTGSGDPKPAPKATTYVQASALRAKCGLPFMAYQQDLDQWLPSLC